VDRLAEKANPSYGLPPVCYTALTAAAAVHPGGTVLTFVTQTGKSLQVLLRLPDDKTRAFCAELTLLIRPGQRRRRYVRVRPIAANGSPPPPVAIAAPPAPPVPVGEGDPIGPVPHGKGSRLALRAFYARLFDESKSTGRTVSMLARREGIAYSTLLAGFWMVEALRNRAARPILEPGGKIL
jgi:hypothetical protein